MSREKEPAPGGRAKNEIVEEIVTHLRPWKPRNTAAAITNAVNDQLEMLVKLAPLQAKLYDRAGNRAHAKRLDEALGEVERLLAAAPSALAWFLFDPLPPMTLTEDGEPVQDRRPIQSIELAYGAQADPVSPTTPNEDGERVTQSIEDIELAYRARADSFFAELARLRKVCARAVDPGFGFHPNYDDAKHLCAWWAYVLMRDLSDRKISGTEDKAFRVITGLLYEALSGKPDADLKRACDAVLQDARNRLQGTD